MSHKPVVFTGDETTGTVLTMINPNPGRGHYGSLPTTTIRHESTQQGVAKNGAENVVRRETSSAFSTFGNTQELYKKEIDWTVVSSTGRILMIAAGFALVLAIGMIAGASVAASVCLFVNAACIVAVFARQIFLLFLLSVAGVSTIRSAYYKQRKLQLLIALIANLLAFLLLGGALYLAVHRLTTGEHYKVRPIAFLATSVVALPFIVILCGLLSMARKLEDQGRRSKSRTPTAKASTKSPGGTQSKGALVSGFSRFSKERGLILRRTLNRVSIRSNHYLVLILLLQSLVAFIAALIAYFKPHTLISDSVLALLFTPLAVIMTVCLVWDVISVMTEGILQGVDFGEIAEALINIDGVTAVRHLRIWSMKTDEVSLSVQIAIERFELATKIRADVGELLRDMYGIRRFAVQVEHEDNNTQPIQESYPGLEEEPETKYYQSIMVI